MKNENEILNENSDRLERRKLFCVNFNGENGAFPLSWCRCNCVRWSVENTMNVLPWKSSFVRFAQLCCVGADQAQNTFDWNVHTFVINFSCKAKCSLTLRFVSIRQQNTNGVPFDLLLLRRVWFASIQYNHVRRSPHRWQKPAHETGNQSSSRTTFAFFFSIAFKKQTYENGAKMPSLPSQAHTHTNVLIHSVFNSTQRVFQLFFLRRFYNDYRLSLCVCVCSQCHDCLDCSTSKLKAALFIVKGKTYESVDVIVMLVTFLVIFGCSDMCAECALHRRRHHSPATHHPKRQQPKQRRTNFKLMNF